MAEERGVGGRVGYAGGLVDFRAAPWWQFCEGGSGQVGFAGRRRRREAEKRTAGQPPRPPPHPTYPLTPPRRPFHPPTQTKQYLLKNGGVDSEDDYAYWGYGLVCQRKKEADRCVEPQGRGAGVARPLCPPTGTGLTPKPPAPPRLVQDRLPHPRSLAPALAPCRHVVTIDGYEDVPANDGEALKKALAHQPVAVAICASYTMQVGCFEKRGIESGLHLFGRPTQSARHQCIASPPPPPSPLPRSCMLAASSATPTAART